MGLPPTASFRDLLAYLEHCYCSNLIHILPGAIIAFTRDDTVTAKVVDDRLVEFTGEAMSLSEAARRALAVAYQVQGPVSWKYKGETLDERRTRMEQGE